MEQLIVLFVIIPLASAFLIPVVGRLVPYFQKVLTSMVLLALTILIFSYLFSGSEATLIYKVGGWEAVENIPIGIYLVLDGLSAILLLVINFIGLLAAFYAVGYMRRYTAENNFYALLCLMVAGMNGVVLTGDLFNLYVFLEIAVIASYALVAFGIEKNELEASFKYQVLGGMASLLILFGIGMIYWLTKTLNIADVAQLLKGSSNTSAVQFTQIVLIAGFGLKGAMIPFHAWLPDAHSSAPSPISAMLSGVLIKAIGIYAILRLFFNMFTISYELALIITVIGTLSMVIGVLLAIGQWDLKRLLAYHSISQMGYVVIGVGMGMMILTKGGEKGVAALAIAGGLFHLMNHAVFKGLLFLNAGAIEYLLGTRNLKKMGGLGKNTPITSASSFSASMAISGIPPFNGFFSKLLIIIAAVKGHFYLLALLAVFVSIITLGSFLKFQRYAFFNKMNFEGRLLAQKIPFTMTFSMVVMAVLCLVMSLMIFPGAREVFLTPAVEVLVNSMNYSTTVIGF
ncbi:Multiple resistance and pH homeostasis protein D [Salinivirga cyanobacteriivorans]|uniref:Multiple resistance and pH homeostasis protein D n=1 Tax=Salinivirga cyanobacteriivorans TaxID=1307839 RepID=A0A0S2HXX9_9BACT|nr:proton-conducting transporter membrane subunit [Salinivirga cyanobacteriivorans]ALO14906.1 Multiple resistance and pH homeostasis protein D [Salinivirga cyanobacteriivorans]